MCDDLTAIEEEAALAAKGLSRRDFAALGGAGLLAGAFAAPADAKEVMVVQDTVSIPTPDGTADALFFRPTRGKHPAVILWPDIAGVREAYRQMGMRLAANGYAVLVVNQYYRSAKAPIMNSIAEWRTPAGQEKLKPMIGALSADGIVRDAKAFVAWLDKRREVNKRRGIGTSGYCMGGPFAVRTAWAVPNRVKAAASFHGGGLVTDKADSPHKLLAASRASYLIAIARNDDAKAPADKDTFREAAKAAGRQAEIEVYNADHGWCTLDAPVYDKAEAERAWARMLVLFGKL
ncbi:MAG: dienelactone hydrolase family protein [Novosphingobium sp.]